MERKVISSVFDKDENILYKAVADTIKDAIGDILQKKDYVVLAIAGGRSVPFVFEILKKKDIPWDKVHIFMVDERLVPIDDKESNFKLAKETFIGDLIKKGKLPEENTHPFILDNEASDKGLSTYENELNKFGSIYDIVLL